MQVLDAIVIFVANLVDDRSLRGQVTQQLKDDAFAKNVMEQQNLSTDSLVGMANFSMMAMTVLAAGVCALLTWRAGRGGNYSRMFLNVGSFYLAITAVLMLFSQAPETLPLGFLIISGILTILSGVVAILGFTSSPAQQMARGWDGRRKNRCASTPRLCRRNSARKRRSGTKLAKSPKAKADKKKAKPQDSGK